ncbi:MAG: succinate dehydrogenase assembly factor 2 [Pseudomonadota bacterium]|nr:succinate dehydrogenase assembly factor 2 [Pseudomonadota bacterium]
MTLSRDRLRWLCRRGMLELDAWLTRFLDVRYTDLPADQQAVFASLLNQDDMDLFDWITGECASPAEFRCIVAEIKTTRYPKT